MQEIAAHMSSTVALALAILLGASAAHKLMDRPRMAAAVSTLTGLAPTLAPFGLAVAFALESAAAILLLLPDSAALGAVLGAGIWATYLGFILSAILRGRRDVDCGCSFAPRHAPLGRFEILRNLTLISLAAFVIVAPPMGAALITASGVLAAFAFALLYAATEQISALRNFRRVHHGN